MVGIIKCDRCWEKFDVDQLGYTDQEEKFTCPACGSDKFRPLIGIEGLPGSVTLEGIIEPDLATALRKMILILKELHNQRIYGPDDSHQENCGYCAIIKEAEEALRKNKSSNPI